MSLIISSLFKMATLQKPSMFLKVLIMNSITVMILTGFLAQKLAVSHSRILHVVALVIWFLRRSISTPLMMIAL